MKAQYTMENGRIVSRADEFQPYVEGIAAAQTLSDVAAAVETFLAYADTLDGFNSFGLYQSLHKSLGAFAEPYRDPPKSKKHKIIYVPPNDSPRLLLAGYIDPNMNGIELEDSLNKFVADSREYGEPTGDFATDEEIQTVFRAAQRRFKILDVIASKRKLMILRLDATHNRMNSVYRFSNGQTEAGWIVLHHLRPDAQRDAAFVTAHEVGHALHLALTGNSDVMPKGFKEFNKQLHPTTEFTIDEDRENFADAVAFVVLGGSLNKHLPAEYERLLLPMFSRYIGGQTVDYLKAHA